MTVLNDAKAIYIGPRKASAVYLGSKRVWPTTEPPQSSYWETVLSDNPSAYYRLGELTGPMLDLMGGPSGTVTEGWRRSQPSILPNGEGNSMLAESYGPGWGNYGGVVVPDAPGNRLGTGVDFTVEAWMRPIADVIAWPTLVDHDGERYFSIFFQDQWTVHFIATSYSLGLGGAEDAGLLPNNTYHYVLSWKFVPGGAELSQYINGQLTSVSSIPFYDIYSRVNSIGFRIGASMTGGSPWPGYLQEFALYDYALPADRVAAHYQAAQS